jgi:hypothetical protein
MQKTLENPGFFMLYCFRRPLLYPVELQVQVSHFQGLTSYPTVPPFCPLQPFLQPFLQPLPSAQWPERCDRSGRWSQWLKLQETVTMSEPHSSSPAPADKPDP